LRDASLINYWPLSCSFRYESYSNIIDMSIISFRKNSCLQLRVRPIEGGLAAVYSAVRRRHAEAAGAHLAELGRQGLSRVRHGLDDQVRVLPVPGCNLVRGDEAGVAGLDGAEGVPSGSVRFAACIRTGPDKA
jgi:hypothetical protein